MITNWVKNQFYNLRDSLMPPQGGDVEYEYYVRNGDCNQCGQCCAGISLVHHDGAIQTVEEFEYLKVKYPDYRHFEPIEETPHGVVFKCKNLNEDNSCGIYDSRPLFCRKYPSESTLLLGGQLAPECGYGFTKKVDFQSVLASKSHPSNWKGMLGFSGCKAGKIMNDVLQPIRQESKVS